MFEREVIEFFAPLYDFDDDNRWGLITHSGSDGNNHSIYFGAKLTLLDDLTTTLSISDMTKALELARASASARRNYADQQTIDQYTQQLNALVKAEMTCKGVNQTIPMKLVTSKFGVDYWTMPAFNFADENGHVSLVDLPDTG